MSACPERDLLRVNRTMIKEGVFRLTKLIQRAIFPNRLSALLAITFGNQLRQISMTKPEKPLESVYDITASVD